MRASRVRAIGCGSFENRLRLKEKKPGEQCSHRENEPHHGEPEGTDDPGSLCLFQLSSLLAFLFLLVVPFSFSPLLQILFLLVVHGFIPPRTFGVYQTT
jgi:hypothetical protein